MCRVPSPRVGDDRVERRAARQPIPAHFESALPPRSTADLPRAAGRRGAAPTCRWSARRRPARLARTKAAPSLRCMSPTRRPVPAAAGHAHERPRGPLRARSREGMSRPALDNRRRRSRMAVPPWAASNARGNCVHFGRVVLAELTLGIGAGGVEISQPDGADAARALEVRQRVLDGQLRLAMRVDRRGRMRFAIGISVVRRRRHMWRKTQTGGSPRLSSPPGSPACLPRCFDSSSTDREPNPECSVGRRNASPRWHRSPGSPV